MHVCLIFENLTSILIDLVEEIDERDSAFYVSRMIS
jgi:hypothetical protein